MPTVPLPPYKRLRKMQDLIAQALTEQGIRRNQPELGNYYGGARNFEEFAAGVEDTIKEDTLRRVGEGYAMHPAAIFMGEALNELEKLRHRVYSPAAKGSYIMSGEPHRRISPSIWQQVDQSNAIYRDQDLAKSPGRNDIRDPRRGRVITPEEDELDSDMEGTPAFWQGLDKIMTGL